MSAIAKPIWHSPWPGREASGNTSFARELAAGGSAQQGLVRIALWHPTPPPKAECETGAQKFVYFDWHSTATEVSYGDKKAHCPKSSTHSNTTAKEQPEFHPGCPMCHPPSLRHPVSPPAHCQFTDTQTARSKTKSAFRSSASLTRLSLSKRCRVFIIFEAPLGDRQKTGYTVVFEETAKSSATNSPAGMTSSRTARPQRHGSPANSPEAVVGRQISLGSSPSSRILSHGKSSNHGTERMTCRDRSSKIFRERSRR